MMSFRLALTSLVVALMLPATAQAVDPRIRYVLFDPDVIVPVTGYTGYQMLIEFGPEEKIETVGIGDSTGWQLTPNAAATVLFLKPIVVAKPTNLTVVTNLRRYNFDLAAKPGGVVSRRQLVYAIRFRYPPPPADPVPAAAAEASPQIRNREYSYTGDIANVPEEVFDDGTSTYFRFAKNTAIPAVFSVGNGTPESLVNFVVRGDLMVVEQVAAQFVLRKGDAVTHVYNDAFVARVPGPDAPKERPKRKRGFLGLFGGSKP